MKEIYTPYVRPDGIIVGIKGKAPEKPIQCEGKYPKCSNPDSFVHCDCYDNEMEYQHDCNLFIQSGHDFEDQRKAWKLLPDSCFEMVNTLSQVIRKPKPGLFPPIELDVTEVWQYKHPNSQMWIDTLDKIKGIGEYRTVLRIAKEEQRPTNPQAETDCKCGSDSPGWTEVKCCNLCGKSVEAFWSQPTEEAKGTQEEQLLNWILDNIDGVDGDWYWKEDTEGDNPMSSKEVIKAYTIQRKTK